MRWRTRTSSIPLPVRTIPGSLLSEGGEMKKEEAYDLYYRGYPVDFDKIGGEMKFKVGDRVKTKDGFGKGILRAVGDDFVGVVFDGHPGVQYGYSVNNIKKIPAPRKSLRRELKDIKSSLRQLAVEACCKDRILGEQIDRMADRVGEMADKI